MTEAFDKSVFANELASFAKTAYFKVNLCDDSSYATDEWYKCFGAVPGMSMAEVLKSHPHVHPVDKYSISAFLANARKGFEQKFRGYMRVMVPGRDLVWRWYQVHIIVTKYAPEDNMIEIQGMQYEVTSLNSEKVNSLLALSQMNDLLRSFNTIPWTYDFRTHIIVTNRSFVDSSIGFDVVNKQMSWDEFVATVLPEYQDLVQNFHDQVYNGIKVRDSIEIQVMLGEHNTPIWVDFTGIAQDYDEAGKAMTAIGTTTVIQERKMAEKAMKEAQQKAEHANKVKTAFLANMSHEFRTPLNAILGFSTIMAHSDTIEERMQCLGAIQSSGTQLLQIIDDVIEYAQIEANEVDMKKHKVDVVQVVEQAFNEIKPSHKPKVEMFFHPEGQSLFALSDDSKVSSVVRHLIGNATKYTDRGRIDVTVSKSSKFITVTIADTGRGMSRQAINHIFDRFYKGDEYVPGTGLGLSIVKRLVELWDGDITVESEEGKGTTFAVTIPVYSNLY